VAPPLATQARHAEGPAEGDLHPGHVEWQGMEVEEPFADKIADGRHAQLFGTEHGDPSVLLRLIMSLTASVRRCEACKRNRPTSQGWSSAARGCSCPHPSLRHAGPVTSVAVVAGVDDQQTALSGKLLHDRSLAPVFGFMK
jgi:hypothetical protein